MAARAEHADLLSVADQLLGRFGDARPHALRSFTLHARLRHRPGQVFAALRLGDLHRQTEYFRPAHSWYARAGRLARLGKDFAQARADAAMGRALALRALGQREKALREFATALASYRKNRDSAGTAYALWAMGTTLRFAGRLIAAESNLRDSVRRYRSLKDASGLAYAQCGLGGTLRMRGLADESFRLYRDAAAVFRRAGDDFGHAYALCGQGSALRVQGRVRQALPRIDRAGTLYRRLKQKGPLGFVLWGRSQAMIKLGRWREAERDLLEAARLFRAARDPRGLLYCELGQGALAAARGQTVARASFRRALRSARRQRLLLEEAHALHGLQDPRANAAYRRAGVDPAAFFRYDALP